MAFAPKDNTTSTVSTGYKLPKLSPDIIKLIDRSHLEPYGEYDKYDIIGRIKYIIMDWIIHNPDILWTLHNEELENKMVKGQDNPNGDDYRYKNIFDFLKVPDIQSTVKNMICYEVDLSEESRYNRFAKRDEALAIVRIKFRTVSHEQDVETDYGIARQDLLALIIKSKFDWSNLFGTHVSMVYDKGRIAENGYYYREFVYECVVPNNLINKAQNGGVTYGIS